MKHCPICNKSSDEIAFYGEFCADCSGKKLREKIQGEVEMVRCRDCGNIKVAGFFVPYNHQNMERLLKSAYKSYVVKLIHSGNGIARMRITDEKQNGIYVEVNAHIKQANVLCDNCAKKRSGYYEAIVQFRGEKGKVSRFSQALERYLEKNGAFVTKIEEKDHGVDVYTSDKKATLSFISARHLKWKGSFELHGEKRGKRLYRNTYFIVLSRPPHEPQ